MTTFATLTVNGSSVGKQFKPGPLVAIARGTWDTATLTLETSADGHNYVPYRDVAFTANGSKEIQYAGGYLRWTVSSAGAGTSLVASIIGAPQLGSDLTATTTAAP